MPKNGLICVMPTTKAKVKLSLVQVALQTLTKFHEMTQCLFSMKQKQQIQGLILFQVVNWHWNFRWALKIECKCALRNNPLFIASALENTLTHIFSVLIRLLYLKKSYSSYKYSMKYLYFQYNIEYKYQWSINKWFHWIIIKRFVEKWRRELRCSMWTTR